MSACCTFRLLYGSQTPRVLHTRDSHLTSIPPAFWSSFSFVTQHINIDEQVSTMEWEGDQIPGQVYDDSPPWMGSQPTLTPTIHPPLPPSRSLSPSVVLPFRVLQYLRWSSHTSFMAEWFAFRIHSNISVVHRMGSMSYIIYANTWKQFGLNYTDIVFCILEFY